MQTRKEYIDIRACIGCAGCKHYPYFHYIPVRDNKDNLAGVGADLEFIKFSNNHSEVINHTTGEKHVYNAINHKWTKL